MQLKYVDTKEEIIAINRKSKHIEPHLHNALEIVCVTSGALELGVGQELYHMEKGDIGFVFPDVIHHYQVLTPGVNKAIYLIASPFTIDKFAFITLYTSGSTFSALMIGYSGAMDCMISANLAIVNGDAIR